jgi:fructose-bisphosphate aldolase class I
MGLTCGKLGIGNGKTKIMNKQILKDTITQLFAGSKGLLAMDENTGTCNKRFAATDIPQTIEIRRKYRELIVTTPGLNESICGAILYDETIRQQTKGGIPFTDVLMKAEIIPGIKVDIVARQGQCNAAMEVQEHIIE